MLQNNERALRAAMKQLGVTPQQIPATKVTIMTATGEIIIENPNVVKINMMGQETFQISGNSKTQPYTQKITDEDIKLVMTQTNTTQECARKTIEETGGIAEAIIKLKS